MKSSRDLGSSEARSEAGIGTGSPGTAARRLIGTTVLLAALGMTSACGADDSADADPAPTPTIEATEESLTDFANTLIEAINDGDQKAADAMDCDGQSTIYTTYAGLGSKWAVSAVDFGSERSIVEFDVAGAPPGPQDQRAVLAFTAVFSDDAWCAEP